MRVEKGRIMTNYVNTKNFKKVSKKVMQIASLPLLTTVIPSSKFAGMSFQKCSLEKLTRKNSQNKIK